MNWSVHKFGGTSVADAARYKHVCELIQSLNEPSAAIVVSAMSKVTDALIEISDLAQKQNPDYLKKLEELKQKHISAFSQNLPENSKTDLLKILDHDFEALKEILRGVWHLKLCSERTQELISGHGEVWSAQYLNACFNAAGKKSKWIDARQVLVVEPADNSVSIDWNASQEKIDQWMKNNPGSLYVVTGFVASTHEGVATTLKRNGSDYSASIFGALLKASKITIWTDVDGVLSADPRLVPEAVLLDDLSYAEATELAYFGAKVVHPSTMQPAIQKQIPIWIKNTFNPTCPGTKIHSVSTSSLSIKGFATIDHVAMINIEGTGMLGVPGVAQKLFGSLREVGISVIMISQASSEQSICIAVPLKQAQKAKSTIETIFSYEKSTGAIQNIDLSEDCSVLAAVGDNMISQPGIAGRFLSALGRAGINVRAIAQGSSERNISVVIQNNNITKALRAVHSAFFLSYHTLSVGIIGTGWVGKTLMQQLEQSVSDLKKDLKVDLRIRALANSKKMMTHLQGHSLSTWEKDFEQTATDLNLKKFADHIQADHIPHSVIIDCTADETITDHYPQWIESGIHIITPNKKANTRGFDFYKNLKQRIKSKNLHYLYETTVGAGLPILNTLRELIRTGDEIIEIEGVLSGTLSYIFNTFSAEKSFSTTVLEAKKLGYTEPDPRDDLSGTDVARKLVILAREMGQKIELSDVKIEPLLPAELANISLDDFIKNLPSIDKKMLSVFEEARARTEVLRFVGRIDQNGQASVSLRRYPQSHSFARINATDNIVAFKTKRYVQPLVVQGPGAGPEVTAAGVFADILRLSSYLGAPL